LSVNGQFESEVLDENTKSIFRHLETEHYYGASKLAGELLIKTYSQEYLIPGNFIRLGHTLGPGLDYIDDTRIFSNVISSIMNKKEINLRNPNSRRVFTYIADVLQGVILVLTSEEKGEPFIVVNEGNDIRIGDLVTALGEEYNLVLKLTSDVPLGYVQSSNQIIPMIDTSKIRRLGWKPSTNVLEAFHRTIKYFNLMDEKNK
jgi:nucleoside-diphosphate-sugar epimerase